MTPISAATAFSDSPHTSTISRRRRMLASVAAVATAALLVFGVTPLAAQAVGTGSISGVLLEQSTTGSGNVASQGFINLYSAETMAPAGSAFAGVGGAYTFTDVPVGTYKVQFSSVTHIAQWYSGAATADAATPVIVTSGGQTSGIDAVLAPSIVTISGTVKGQAAAGAANVPLRFTDVSLFAVTNGAVGFFPQFRSFTGPNGEFSFNDLPAGTYKMQIRTSGNQWVSEWYADAETSATATTLAVAAGATLPAIDVVLASTGQPNVVTITGNVTGVDAFGSPAVALGGAPVELYSGDGLSLLASTVTDSTGAYRFTDVEARAYKFRAADFGAHFGEWLSDRPNATLSPTITFVGGETGTGINFELSKVADDHTQDLVRSPSITGTPEVGSTLTVVGGMWSPQGGTTSAQWLRNGVAITGATAVDYVVTAADAGASISVRVTSTNPGYRTDSATTSAVTFAAAAILTGPVPTISGSAVVGQRLSAAAGVWGPAPVKLSYQWKSNGVAISGAVWPTYVVGSAHVGKSITVTVTGAKAGFASAARTSAATVTVSKGILSSSVPTIAGTAKVGQTLTATAGVWAPASVKLTYKWTANGVTIAGATASTFTLTGAQVGKKIVVKVTGTKAGYTTVTTASVATGAVVR